MMYRSDKDSPHSHSTPVAVVPTIVGIPSTVNPLPRFRLVVKSSQSESKSKSKSGIQCPKCFW